MKMHLGKALDCDILFSCVDRPFPRYILNYLSYANCIPVIDGGIDASMNKQQTNIQQARWRSITTGPHRLCLECFEQYTPEDVALEMSGELNDPLYIDGLPDDHFAKKGENVYIFSHAAGTMQMLQFLSLLLRPQGVCYGPKEMNLTTGTVDSEFPFTCKESCLTHNILATGEQTNISLLQPQVEEVEAI